jgi:Autotransporter beta-domain
MDARTRAGFRLLLSLSFLAVMLIGGEAFAQARGEVSARPKGSAGLEALARRMVEAPEARLDLYIAPEVTYEKFDDYTIVGEFEDPNLGVPTVISPSFSITTIGTSAGADYLFPNGLLLGGAFSYSHANYDFGAGSVTQFVANPDISAPRRVRQAASVPLGEPLDRSYDEYGFTLAAGYVKDPWAFLLTGGYARRTNIETLRRSTELFAASRFVVEAEGDTDSDVYSAGLGVNYRVDFANGAALTGLSSFLYQVEDIDGYTETVQSVSTVSIEGVVDQVPISTYIDSGGSEQVRKFNSQTIKSLPLEVGALFSYPLGKLVNLNLGTTYTHDFDNQERTIKSEFVANPGLSVEYEEKNRNRDFVSVMAGLDFNLLNVAGTLSYQGDLGFDEREYAHIFALQLRVPLSF